VSVVTQDSPFSLAGRTALVTGGGRGVGAGIARMLAGAGASVAVNDLHEDRARSVAATLEGAVPAAFDVTDDAAVHASVEQLLERWGRIDVLVHNAGIPDGGSRRGRVATMESANWEQQLELNLTALMRMVRAVVPHQMAQRWGRVIQVSSAAASRGLGIGVGSYAAAKAGGESLIRHLAVESAPHNVTANVLALGMMEGLPREDEPELQRMIRAVPAGRLGRADEVGAAAVWLSTELGAFVTGQVIHLNGGSHFGR
jgi:3-oxoacyl-[acyl-carrier protein] reductase